jgi:hypothetical protein
MKKFIVFILTLIYGCSLVNADYNCRNPNDCSVYCSNVEPYLVDSLKHTPWITVPWDDGSCYFHNTKTMEDSETYPFTKIE